MPIGKTLLEKLNFKFFLNHPDTNITNIAKDYLYYFYRRHTQQNNTWS